MKKTVWTFGLISGAIISILMAITIPFQDEIGFDHSLLVGYTTMVLAFLLIYFGVRSYRDNVRGGSVRFGRAFAVGALIAVISSLCYVATWEVMYYKFMPDFLSKYQAHALDKARAAGASEDALAKQKAEMDKFGEMYKNPVVNAAMTIVEPLPVGLFIALVSAGILSRGRKPDTDAMMADARGVPS
jgi:amino acid transporter